MRVETNNPKLSTNYNQLHDSKVRKSRFDCNKIRFGLFGN